MLLKRKRSESELSYSSCSTGSALNSPPRPGPSSFASTHPDAESTWPMRWQMATASHLPSRTMKRFRNGRPSEDEVHQRTIDILFSAAQRPQADEHESPMQQRPQGVHAQPSAPEQHHTQQASLHSFWELPNSQSLSAAAHSVASPRVDTSIYAPEDCEDCGQALRGDHDEMDIDGYGSGEAETGCAGCGKHVCSHCSITNMGERRRCLGCADTGKKIWVGGIGFTSKVPSRFGIF
ncbi:hypothetical protein AB5N19_08475 [Seiridium cardinale]